MPQYLAASLSMTVLMGVITVRTGAPVLAATRSLEDADCELNRVRANPR